jgi:hypothetical protein
MLPSSMLPFRQHTIMADLNFGRRDSARLTRGSRATVTCTVLVLLAVIASLTNVDHHLSSRRQQRSSRRMRWLAARQSDSGTRYRVDAARRASGVDVEPLGRIQGRARERAKWREHIQQTLFRPVLLIDEAQEMSAPVFAELRVLGGDPARHLPDRHGNPVRRLPTR